MSAPPGPRWEDHSEHFRILRAAALEAADPARAVRRVLASQPLPSGRVFLVALGKASIAMTTAALERVGERVTAGVVAHPRGTRPPEGWSSAIQCIAAGHPLPDEGSLRAGAAAWDMLESAGRGDFVLVLVSGGGSALFEHLRPGVSLEDLAALTRDLQRAGADIRELNTVRRALSLVKGGGLAARAGEADLLALLLSDVVGDDPAAIASGPTVPSPTGPPEALAVLGARHLAGARVRIERALLDSPRGQLSQGEGKRDTRIVGSNRLAADAARDAAAKLGFQSSIVDLTLHGEARTAGDAIARQAKRAAFGTCLIWGGETTVTVTGNGRGGRNLELALAAAMAFEGEARRALMSFATDGMDGTSGDAGAVVTGDTMARARALDLSALEALDDNDTAAFFEKVGDVVRTGYTGTNVNDLVVALAYA
ncbi:MAG TPA: DUF4147 domain-containing protein [Candidatus Eisenbacteria bacterium]|nr:DUF4147 domain-containing protein [Candidatus Eisenbacteria bacterium]